MCGVNAMARRLSVASVSALVLLLAGPGAAQMSFEQGSFEAAPAEAGPAEGAGTAGGGWGSSEAADAAVPEGAAAPDEFGGSFESGSFEAPVTPPDASAVASTATEPAPATDDSPPARDESAAAEPPLLESAAPTDAEPEPEPGISVHPQILAFETRDFGVPPTGALRFGELHAATPTSLWGGNVATTEGLAAVLAAGSDVVVIDVLGSDYVIPGAYTAPALAAGGHFGDRTQQQAAQWLANITDGDQDMPIVVYCSDPLCWLSYNAGLRVLVAGYPNVYWYRGGLQAWRMAGLPLEPAGF